MAGPGSSMLYSFLLFTVILSLQEMYRGKLASTELFTILGGFISSLIFLVLLTVSSKFHDFFILIFYDHVVHDMLIIVIIFKPAKIIMFSFYRFLVKDFVEVSQTLKSYDACFLNFVVKFYCLH